MQLRNGLMSDLWQETRQSLSCAETSVSIIEHDEKSPRHRSILRKELLIVVEYYLRLLQKHDATVVGIDLDNSIACIVAVLACVGASVPFVPLDTSWPASRVKEIATIAKIDCVFWSDVGEPGGRGKRTSYLPRSAESLLPKMIQVIPFAHEDDECKSVNGSHSYPSNSDASINDIDDDLAYIMFTSGSTGAPAAVLGSRQGILHRCWWMQGTEYLLNETDLVICKTPLSFVDSIWEIFGPILGGSRILIPLKEFNKPISLAWVIECSRIHNATHLTAVPSIWESFLDLMEYEASRQTPKPILSFRQVVSSGEILSWNLLDRLQKILPNGCKILNIYGCTETSADSVWCNCSTLKQNMIHCEDNCKKTKESDTVESLIAKEEDSIELLNGHWFRAPPFSVPIGTPVPGTFLGLVSISDFHLGAPKLLDLRKSRDVLSGEIIIGGIGLAHGYLRNNLNERFKWYSADLVRELCLHDSNIPWLKLANEHDMVKVFTTGDIGCFIPSSADFFVTGRKDMQVKVDGIRIDLLEVENMINECDFVKRSAVVPIHNPLNLGSCILHAFCEINWDKYGVSTNTSPEESLQKSIAKYLPSVAIPKNIKFTESLPCTVSGKIDRIALINSVDKISKAANVLVRGDRISESRYGELGEMHIASAFHTVFGTRYYFEPTDDIFQIGANSLDASRIANILNIPVEFIFHFPSIRKLAKHMSKMRAEEPRTQNLDKCSTDTTTFPAHSLSKSFLLKMKWRFNMKDCVDARPIFDEDNSVIFVASHFGQVSCLDAISGYNNWSVQIENFPHCDPGLAIMLSTDKISNLQRLLVVVTSEGFLYFLCTTTGKIRNSVSAGSGIRAEPVIDPWFGYLWLTTHGANVLAFDSSGLLLLGESLPAAASAGAVFMEIPDSSTKVCLVACLDGSIVCFDIKAKFKRSLETAAELHEHGENNAGRFLRDNLKRNISITKMWMKNIGAPVFAKPVVSSSGIVISVNIEGMVYALNLTNGTTIWILKLLAKENEATESNANGYFTDPVLLTKKIFDKSESMVLFASQLGTISILNVMDGELKHEKRVSAGALTGMSVIRPKTPYANKSDELMVVAIAADGMLLLIDINHKGLVDIVDCARLPAASFGLSISRAFIPARIAVGCRDSNVYCFLVK